MIISESTVDMQSTRKFSAKYTESHVRTTGSMLVFRNGTGQQFAVTDESEGGRVEKSNSINPDNKEVSKNTKIRFATLIYLWKQMFQKGGKGSINELISDLMSKSGYSLVTDYSSYSYEESEETNFNVKGAVKTADGRSIEFDVAVGMSRAFMNEYSLCTESIVQNAYLDPLVINLDCNACDVKKQSFSFDLNCDGKMDNIGMLSEGSGYLALDLNENGIIDDGSELFGTKSGNGFYDLSFYDEDGNGWIDEADSVYSKLKIMSVDHDGKQHLYGLKESDVGAIYLGEVKSQFSITDSSNNELARVKSSGIFLRESGGVGSVQNLDYVV